MKTPKSTPALILKPGREKPLFNRHPWIFSGAVARVEGGPAAGDTVGIRAADGAFLAWGAFSPASQIRARVWTFDKAEQVDSNFFGKRLRAAVGRRAAMGLPADGTDAYRVVFSESDGLPGFILDKYGELLALQALSAGAEAHKRTLAQIAMEELGCRAVYERSDTDARALEGLPEAAGPLVGETLDGPARIEENGLKYLVDVRGGHKTGFYLDQRENRRFASLHSHGREVLNCFSYTGAFTVAALAGGAESVVSVDTSESALALGRENAALNGFASARLEWRRDDVFDTLREYEAARRGFDLIILDPPKFAASMEQVKKAERAYKDINMLALKILRPGGLLLTFSCSGAIAPADFFRIVAWAAKDAQVTASVTARMSQAPDHPVALSFPPAEYLKGLAVLKG